MSGTFSRSIRAFIDESLSPAALSHELARIARTERDELIRTGEASPVYETFVDQRRGASEETVRPDGVIRYEFDQIGEAAEYGLDACRRLSPMESGVFRLAWVLSVNHRPWFGDVKDIPTGAEVLIVNPLPYARKIETGAMPKMSVEPGIVQRAAQRIKRQFPAISAFVTYVQLPPAFSIGEFHTPYILRGRQRSFAVAHEARIRASGGRSVATRRKDLMAGEQITYPAIELSARL